MEMIMKSLRGNNNIHELNLSFNPTSKTDKLK